MSTSIPLNFRASPIPSDFSGTPQELCDALVARLSAESTNSISFFASGSVAPSSNVGPWLKDDNTWYIWDNSTAAYIPLTIESASLGYIAAVSAPDPLIYTFWIQLSGAGKAMAIKYYSAGAWHDIYEDAFASLPTTASMNAAIAAAIAGIPVSTGSKAYPAKATATSTQTFLVNGAEVKVDFGTQAYDPDGCYDPATSEYTFPVSGYYQVDCTLQCSNLGATLANLETMLTIRTVGASDEARDWVCRITSGLTGPGNRFTLECHGQIFGDIGNPCAVYLNAGSTPPSGSIDVNAAQSQFAIHLIQKA